MGNNDNDRIDIGIKFPDGMSDRDIEVILDMVREHMRQNPPKDGESQESIAARIQAFIGEHLPYNTREIDPK